MQLTLIAIAITCSVALLVWLLFTFKKAGKDNALNDIMDKALAVQKKVLNSFATHERARAEHTSVRLDLLERIRERNKLSEDE